MTGMSLLLAMEVYVIWFFHRPFAEMSLVTGLPLLLNILILLINFSCQVVFLRLARYFKNLFVEAGFCTQLAFANSMLLNKNSSDASKIWFWIIEISSLSFVYVIFKNAVAVRRQIQESICHNSIESESA